MMPGETILILFGAISGAIPLANASTAPPTDEIAICPGLHFLAGEPLTKTMFPLSLRYLVGYVLSWFTPYPTFTIAGCR